MLNLEARFYSDPSTYAAERDKIFRRSWQLLGPESWVADSGAYLAADIAGMSVFIMRGADGVLRGFQNVCRHRGSRLLEAGAGKCATVSCPYHGWQYNDRGELVATPWFGERSPFDMQQWALAAIAVKAWRGLVFAAIAPEVSWDEQLGELPKEIDMPIETFTATAAARFTANINWKVYIDQFNEFYHTPSVHLPDKDLGLDQYTAEPRPGMMLMMAPANTAYYGGRWLWGWPNWTLSLFAGGMKTSRINPISTEQVEVHFHYYFADTSDAAASARQRVIDATSRIFSEDARACERVQASYSSGQYRPGPLHPRLEKSVSHFQIRVRNTLAGV
jgi:choline monooxygenase